MARTKRNTDHSAAFVVGSLLGGLAGAVLALWKTPQSGPELRTRLSGSFGSGDTHVTPLTPNPAPTIDPGRVVPPGQASGDPPPTGIGHPASTEELTSPPPVSPE
jgi:hypothetical protein